MDRDREIDMKRREFIAGLAGISLSTRGARAQRKLSVIGIVNANPVGGVASGVRIGLAQQGYIEGRDFAFEFRGESPFGPDQQALIAANIADLVQRGVTLIVVYRLMDALAAKEATRSIPIIFSVGGDPVATGLVESLNRPGGNLTGNANLNIDLIGKRLEILHEVVPNTSTIGFIVNPTNATYAEIETKQLQISAQARGVRLLIENVAGPNEIDRAFAGLVRDGAGALIVSGDALFYNIRDQINLLTLRYALPSIYATRAWATAGGLISYGTDYSDGYRLIGVYAARILKGEKPADLPVQQITKIEFVINLKTAKALGLTVPPSLLATADEVIE